MLCSFYLLKLLQLRLQLVSLFQVYPVFPSFVKLRTSVLDASGDFLETRHQVIIVFSDKIAFVSR